MPPDLIEKEHLSNLSPFLMRPAFFKARSCQTILHSLIISQELFCGSWFLFRKCISRESWRKWFCWFLNVIRWEGWYGLNSLFVILHSGSCVPVAQLLSLYPQLHLILLKYTLKFFHKTQCTGLYFTECNSEYHSYFFSLCSLVNSIISTFNCYSILCKREEHFVHISRSLVSTCLVFLTRPWSYVCSL